MLIIFIFFSAEAAARGVLWKSYSEKFRKILRKTLAPESFLIKMHLEPCNILEKETLAQFFSCEFCKIFKNSFFTEHLRVDCSCQWNYIHRFHWFKIKRPRSMCWLITTYLKFYYCLRNCVDFLVNGRWYYFYSKSRHEQGCLKRRRFDDMFIYLIVWIKSRGLNKLHFIYWLIVLEHNKFLNFVK